MQCFAIYITQIKNPPGKHSIHKIWSWFSLRRQLFECIKPGEAPWHVYGSEDLCDYADDEKWKWGLAFGVRDISYKCSAMSHSSCAWRRRLRAALEPDLCGSRDEAENERRRAKVPKPQAKVRGRKPKAQTTGQTQTAQVCLRQKQLKLSPLLFFTNTVCS